MKHTTVNDCRIIDIRKFTDNRGYLSVIEGGQDIHEADIEFQKRVREIYRQQCEIDPKFIRIDCSDDYGQMLPPDEIFAKVKAVVDEAVKR